MPATSSSTEPETRARARRDATTCSCSSPMATSSRPARSPACASRAPGAPAEAMITVTPQAAEQIAKSAQQSAAGGACLRIAARLDGKGVIEYGMGFDDKAEGDVVVAAGGVTLLVSPGSVELLTGATLDYVEINPGEPRFIFINPNDPSHKTPKPSA